MAMIGRNYSSLSGSRKRSRWRFSSASMAMPGIMRGPPMAAFRGSIWTSRCLRRSIITRRSTSILSRSIPLTRTRTRTSNRRPSVMSGWLVTPPSCSPIGGETGGTITIGGFSTGITGIYIMAGGTGPRTTRRWPFPDRKSTPLESRPMASTSRQPGTRSTMEKIRIFSTDSRNGPTPREIPPKTTGTPWIGTGRLTLLAESLSQATRPKSCMA